MTPLEEVAHIANVTVEVEVQLDQRLMKLSEILSLEEGSIIVMGRSAGENIDIFVGSIFDLSAGVLGPIDAIYDRGALVALPREMRIRYAAHLTEIAGKPPQLLICYEYDQSLMEGPPFSIGSEEVNEHYGDLYDITRIASTNVPGGLKGKCAAVENGWLLRIN